MRRFVLLLSALLLGANSVNAMTFSQWLARLSKDRVWETGVLPTIEQTLKRDMSSSNVKVKYKSAIQHAMVVLAKVAEDSSVKTVLKSFGYEINFGGPIALRGVFNTSTAPSVNNTVDNAVTLGRPAIDAALSDLNVIPSTWTGAVIFTPSEWAFLDEEVAIDYGDVLCLKACLNAALGALYFAQGYDGNGNYAEIVSHWAADIPVVAESKSSMLESGSAWGSIPFIKAHDGVKLPQIGVRERTTKFKIARCGNTIWLYRQREVGEKGTPETLYEDAYIRLFSERKFKSKERALWQPYQVKTDRVVFKVDLDEFGFSSQDDVRLFSLDYFSWQQQGNEYLELAEYLNFGDHSLLYLFLKSDGLCASVRKSSALNTAKTYVKQAIDLAIKADAKIVARKDLAYHFFDYDQDSDEQKQLRLKTIAQLKKILESLNSNTTVDIDLALLLTEIERSDIGLSSTEKVNINKLFTGDVTRKLAPTSISTTTYLSSFDRLPDPTLRGLLPAMTKSRIQAISNAYEESLKHYFVMFYSEESCYGWMQPLRCKMNRVENLPLINYWNVNGLKFNGWKNDQNGRIYDDGAMIFNLTDKNDEVILFRAQWK